MTDGSFRLDGRVALVTGGSRGIGRAIALHLGRMGARVAATATSAAGAEGITAVLADAGVDGHGYRLDVTNGEAVAETLRRVGEDLGAPSILVNNAGITRDQLLMRMKDEDWETVINTDLSSVYRLSKACLRDMLKSRHGRIISITSVVGAMGNAGQCNYAAAKAGITGFSRSLAREVASRGVTVNCVAPGFIDTDMTRSLSEEYRQALLGGIPAGRLGTAEDVAAAVGFLASGAASYITGQVLHVNGGMWMD